MLQCYTIVFRSTLSPFGTLASPNHAFHRGMFQGQRNDETATQNEDIGRCARAGTVVARSTAFSDQSGRPTSQSTA